MNIAVLGTGMVGRAIAGRLDELGHDVVVGTRDPAGHARPHRARRHGQPAVRRVAGRARRRRACGPSPTPRPAAELVVNATSATPPSTCSAWPGRTTWPARCCSTSPTRWTSRRLPAHPVRQGHRLARRAGAARLPRRPGGQDAEHADRRPDGAPGVAGRGQHGLRLRRRREAKAVVTGLLEIVRPRGRDRPRRHRDRARHRDAAAGVAAADGRARHAKFNFKIVR